MTTAIVVDDDIDTTDVLIEFLEFKNIQVLGKGYSGKDAVNLFQKLTPDVVYLDVMMPYYDGFYGLEKIRQLNSTACVIMITGDLTTETTNRLQALKASAIIYKPYDINRLMEITETLLKKKQSMNMIIQNSVSKCIYSYLQL